MALTIKTISEKLDYVETFDERVNEALADGWDLNDRQLIVTNSGAVLYAALCKYEDEEDEEADNVSSWKTTRDPLHPYRCSACGYLATGGELGELPQECPSCGAVML